MEVFGYTRISVDLDEDSRENTSIENQKKIITDFVGSTFPDAHLTLFEDRDRSGRESLLETTKDLLRHNRNLDVHPQPVRKSRTRSLDMGR